MKINPLLLLCLLLFAFSLQVAHAKPPEQDATCHNPCTWSSDPPNMGKWACTWTRKYQNEPNKGNEAQTQCAVDCWSSCLLTGNPHLLFTVYNYSNNYWYCICEPSDQKTVKQPKKHPNTK